MGRNSPVSAEVVRLVFTLKNDNGWNLSRIGAHFGKSKTWASQVLTRYSPESLSPNITQKHGRKRETDEVDDGVKSPRLFCGGITSCPIPCYAIVRKQHSVTKFFAKY